MILFKYRYPSPSPPISSTAPEWPTPPTTSDEDGIDDEPTDVDDTDNKPTYVDDKPTNTATATITTHQDGVDYGNLDGFVVNAYVI